jgi:hypothetical protein
MTILKFASHTKIQLLVEIQNNALGIGRSEIALAIVTLR